VKFTNHWCSRPSSCWCTAVVSDVITLVRSHLYQHRYLWTNKSMYMNMHNNMRPFMIVQHQRTIMRVKTLHCQCLEMLLQWEGTLLLSCVRLVTRSGFRSRHWQLIGMSWVNDTATHYVAILARVSKELDTQFAAGRHIAQHKSCSPIILDWSCRSKYYNLRSRTHNKSLITKTTHLTDRDFIVRMLYKDSY